MSSNGSSSGLQNFFALNCFQDAKDVRNHEGAVGIGKRNTSQKKRNRTEKGRRDKDVH